MDNSEEAFTPRGRSSIEVGTIVEIDDETPTNSPRSRSTSCTIITSSNEENIASNYVQGMTLMPQLSLVENNEVQKRSIGPYTHGTKISPKIGTDATPKSDRTNCSHFCASKGGAGTKDTESMKNMKVTSFPPQVAKQKSELRVSLSARPARLAGGATKPARPAEGPVKKSITLSAAEKCKNAKPSDASTSSIPPTVGLMRRNTFASIPRHNCLSSNSLNSSSARRPRGDFSGQRNARDRVRDNNKKKVFETQLQKVEAVQTEFLRKWEDLKRSLPDMTAREFKFVAVMQNEECKFVVHSDYLKKLPNKLPTHAVADFKNAVQDVLSSYLVTVQDQVKNKGRIDIDHLKDILEQEKNDRLSLLFGKIDDLCSVADTFEQIIAKYKKEMLDAKQSAEDQERQLCELRKAHESQIIAREKALRNEMDLEIAKKNATIADLNKEIEALQKGLEILKLTVQSITNELAVEKKKREALVEEIRSLNDTQATLTKDLYQNEITLQQVNEKNQEIAKLQEELQHNKKLFEEVSQQLLKKATQVMELRSVNEKAKKDYAALEENLNAASKELKKTHDQKQELCELRKAYEYQMIAREHTLKAQFDLNIAKKDAAIADLTAEVQALRKEQQILKQTGLLITKDQDAEEDERERLLEEINLLNETQATLTKKLQHNELTYEITLRQLNDKTEEIVQLQRELAKKDYVALQQKLNTAREELEEMREYRVRVANYEAEIKKLKQYSLEKDKELAECSRSRQQYPVEISQLMLTNTKLKRQIEKLKTELISSHRSTIQLLKQVKGDHGLEEVRRELYKTLKHMEADQRNCIKEYEEDDQIPDFQIVVQSESYEFQTLSTNVGLKQPVLSRKEHQIKLMQEHIDRIEKDRLKQIDQIVYLEQEVYALKQTIEKLKIDSHNVAQMNTGHPHYKGRM